MAPGGTTFVFGAGPWEVPCPHVDNEKGPQDGEEKPEGGDDEDGNDTTGHEGDPDKHEVGDEGQEYEETVFVTPLGEAETGESDSDA